MLTCFILRNSLTIVARQREIIKLLIFLKYSAAIEQKPHHFPFVVPCVDLNLSSQVRRDMRMGYKS